MDTRLCTLELIEKLLKELDMHGIPYCHWKSNVDIEKSLCGDIDLDLLVDRRHSTEFSLLLYRLGFKRAVASPQRRFPGIEDFYGLDEVSGKLVHIHVHYRLILGEPYLKSIHLPIEQYVLATARKEGLLRVAAPEYELIAFVLRMILRVRWIDVINRRDMLLHIERELKYLKSQVSVDALPKALDRCGIRMEVFDAWLNALSAGSVWRLLLYKHDVRKALKSSIRVNAFERMTVYVLRWGARINRLWGGTTRKKQPVTGGFSIALVGGDGSGKSTLVRELREWLGSVYTVRTFHMGKPPYSFSCAVFFKFLGILKRVGLYRRSGIKSKHKLSRASQFLELIRSWCVARNRHRTFCSIRKSVGRGYIAVIDRYPLPELKQMDNSFTTRHSIDICPGLQRSAEKYYRSISPPDLIIVLQVSPQIAALRKPNEPSEYVQRRAQEVLKVIRPGRNIVLVDADQPLDEVIREVKKTVWEWL